MRVFWWVLFLASIASLVYTVLVRSVLQWRRLPLPAYLAGQVWAGLSMVLLLASDRLEASVAKAALLGSLACLALALWQSVHASRRRL